MLATLAEPSCHQAQNKATTDRQQEWYQCWAHPDSLVGLAFVTAVQASASGEPGDSSAMGSWHSDAIAHHLAQHCLFG
ncbi:hypothetical protein BEK98_11310 [Streptomyces diastatochromogenes]|uniref:Uncharacterized protein n=1 Tax=Streptomyces diastatochromogenes TaxID=42236 RepID=A0A233SMC0_STRDA|nr:hypothetical protein BEK98_11310 [Streptomyces diastatochromogenes]